MGTVHWRKTDARYKKGFPMTVAVPTITDVVFDFCGVLLDCLLYTSDAADE